MKRDFHGPNPMLTAPNAVSCRKEGEETEAQVVPDAPELTAIPGKRAITGSEAVPVPETKWEARRTTRHARDNSVFRSGKTEKTER